MYISKRQTRRYIIFCGIVTVLFLFFSSLNKINKAHENTNGQIIENHVSGNNIPNYIKDAQNSDNLREYDEEKSANVVKDIHNNTYVKENTNTGKDTYSNINLKDINKEKSSNDYNSSNERNHNIDSKHSNQQILSEVENYIEEFEGEFDIKENANVNTHKESIIQNQEKIIKQENDNKPPVTSSKEKSDIEYIEDYLGGELEPEWEWARSVSIVYTWVDGKDVDFLDIKSKYNGGVRKFNSRDRSVDELRYSLRSVQKYMPWHNGTIYILTDNQIPKWLDTTNPRIKMVYHRDIFPEHYRPTYDSNVIELFLDKIPGITEYFLYFNDDVFLNNYVHPCFFFTHKGHYPKAYRSYIVKLTKEKTDEIIKKNSVIGMFQATKYFTRELIRDYFDPKFQYRYLLHTVWVLYRDLMEPFRQLFQEEIKLVASDKLRSPYEVHNLYIYQNYLYYATQHKDFPEKLGGVGKASKFKGSPLPNDVNRTIQKYSCEMVNPKLSKKYIKFGSVNNNYEQNIKKFNIFRNSKDIRVYNLNDEYSKEEPMYQLVEYMITRYPEPTPFEKKEYVDLDLTFYPVLAKINELQSTITDEFIDESNQKEFEEFRNKMKEYQLNVVSKYIDKKEALSPSPKEISQREIEEINFILNPTSDILEEEWEWASTISLVYKLDNKKEKSTEYSILDVEQLRYSIRSVEKYMPWFKGTIYVLINDKSNVELSNQLEGWLNTEHDRIKVISAHQIIPDAYWNSYHPTDNHFIELFFDKIPKISERFIYLNPNHYFVRYTHPRFFFNPESYPKYYYKRPMRRNEVTTLMEKNRPLYNTYELIKDYFGRSYFRTHRFLYDAPCPLYRDLFEPVRQLFMKDIRKIISEKSDILPIYLISNYNIYGTDQPFYPGFVAGYGKVRDAPPPQLNPDRSISFYGFDITTPAIAKKTMNAELPFSNDISNNDKIIRRIKNKKSNQVFFSFIMSQQESMNLENKLQFNQLMNELYQKKSSYEY